MAWRGFCTFLIDVQLMSKIRISSWKNVRGMVYTLWIILQRNSTNQHTFFLIFIILIRNQSISTMHILINAFLKIIISLFENLRGSIQTSLYHRWYIFQKKKVQHLIFVWYFNKNQNPSTINILKYVKLICKIKKSSEFKQG